MTQGRIVFLNGTSSAGKTTLALALQETLGDPWLHVALDQFRDGMPARYRGLNAPAGSTGAQGLNVVPVHTAEASYTAIRFGAMGQTMLAGMHRAIAAMAEAGNNVIVDDILLNNAILEDYLQVMGGHWFLIVGVHCSAEQLDQRESARPGRFPGTARGMMAPVHQHGIYDVEVDTSRMSPAECAALVRQRIESGVPPQAAGTLRKHLCAD